VRETVTARWQHYPVLLWRASIGMRMTVETEQLLQDGGVPEVVYTAFSEWWIMDAPIRVNRRMEWVTQLLKGRCRSTLAERYYQQKNTPFYTPLPAFQRHFQTVINVFATANSHPHETMLTQSLRPSDWNDTPADSNGLVLFPERRNLVSAHDSSESVPAIQINGFMIQPLEVQRSIRQVCPLSTILF
jgi:hypothetical protein